MCDISTSIKSLLMYIDASFIGVFAVYGHKLVDEIEMGRG